MSHKKFGPDRFSRFDVYWIQANKQTDKPNLYIDNPLKTSMYPIEYSVSSPSTKLSVCTAVFCSTLSEEIVGFSGE